MGVNQSSRSHTSRASYDTRSYEGLAQEAEFYDNTVRRTIRGIINLSEPAHIAPQLRAATAEQARSAYNTLLFRLSDEMNPDTFNIVWTFHRQPYTLESGKWIPVEWSPAAGDWVKLSPTQHR